jgi:GWxTD domain-containing protein
LKRKSLRGLTLVSTLLCALPHAANGLCAQSPPADSVARCDRLASVPAYLLRTYHYAAAEGKTRVHVRFGIVNDVLQFTQEEDGRYHAAYEANLSVLDGEQNLAGSRIGKRDLIVADFAATNGRQRLNEEGADFLLAPGAYELRVEISDLHTQRRLRRSYSLALPDFGAPLLQLSTLAFGEDSGRYNLLAVLTDNEPAQGVFYEVYGAQPGDTLEAHYRITDWKKIALAEWRAAFVAEGAHTRRFEALGPRLQYQGLHRLHVTVNARGRKAEAEADFRVQFAAAVVAETEVEELLREHPGLGYLPLRYIASDKEYRHLIGAASEQRERLVETFWQERDPTLGTPANELREEFYRRVAFAQTRFALHGIGKAGWETDRGRIYIIHGAPQEVHHQMGEPDPAPYEIWFYPKQDRRFVFMDKNGSGEYELVNR